MAGNCSGRSRCRALRSVGSIATPVVVKKEPRTLREMRTVVIIEGVPHASAVEQFRSFANPATISVKRTVLAARGQRVSRRGQVAQVVERSPEKAGVGGSTPSLATTFSIT